MTSLTEKRQGHLRSFLREDTLLFSTLTDILCVKQLLLATLYQGGVFSMNEDEIPVSEVPTIAYAVSRLELDSAENMQASMSEIKQHFQKPNCLDDLEVWVTVCTNLGIPVLL